jgi:hypothetical protein
VYFLRKRDCAFIFTDSVRLSTYLDHFTLPEIARESLLPAAVPNDSLCFTSVHSNRAYFNMSLKITSELIFLSCLGIYISIENCLVKSGADTVSYNIHSLFSVIISKFLMECAVTHDKNCIF